VFTGIIENLGEVLSLERRGNCGKLTIRAGGLAAGVELGESVAVNGCCLTVAETAAGADTISFDLLAETLRVTALGDLEQGDAVNLERALRAGDRFGGHFLQGHVDAAVRIVALAAAAADHKLTVELPTGLRGLVIPRGSIAVDGISFTVAELDEDRLTIWIIPHTWRVTNLSRRKAGDRVNLEFDLIGKYVARALELHAAAPA
jgi:riboflavin synthase